MNISDYQQNLKPMQDVNFYRINKFNDNKPTSNHTNASYIGQFVDNQQNEMHSGQNNYGYNVIGYYPDSDLETIAEESSVIDSEAGGSIRSRLSSQATSVRSGGSDDSDCTIQSNDDFAQQPMGGEMVNNLKSNNKIGMLFFK